MALKKKRIMGMTERFWSEATVTDTGCLIYNGFATDEGYGKACDRFGKNRPVHRIMYEEFTGLPAGESLDHLCRVTRCFNPDHLESVPIAVNILRGFNPAAQNARLDRCKRGHPFTPENTQRWGNGRRRYCIACRAERRARLKAAA